MKKYPLLWAGLFLLSAFYTHILAQGQKIELDRITQPKVEKFLSKCHLNCAGDLAGIQPLCSIKEDPSFKFTTKSFVIEAPVETVWKAYQNINPERAWSGNKASFGFMYSKTDGNISYSNDEFRGMELGQMIFINLHLLGGWFNIAVGHEVTEINEDQKYLRLCYLENGASQGSQFIYFSKMADGRTRIVHDTYYKSASDFRDRKLYPTLHNMFIKEYHSNMAKLIEEEISSSDEGEILVSEHASL